jgi:hypothetical protein
MSLTRSESKLFRFIAVSSLETWHPHKPGTGNRPGAGNRRGVKDSSKNPPPKRIDLSVKEVDRKISHCLTEDISVKGIRIQSEKFLPLNSTLKIQLSLREPSRVLNILGKIRWIRKLKACEVFEMGIEIVETSKEDSGALKHHLDESP